MQLKRKIKVSIVLTRLGLDAHYEAVQALLHLAQALLHEVCSVHQLLNGTQQVQVCLRHLFPRRLIHAVNAGGPPGGLVGRLWNK